MNGAGIATGDRAGGGGGGTVFTALVVGSFNRLKLQHIALAAFGDVADEIPNLRLRFIGVPHDRGYYDELAERAAASPHRDRIELVPGLSRAETIAALAEAQVFLSVSLVEGNSLALLEAATMGCVCIASDVGAARDLAVTGGSVVLVPSPLGELEQVSPEQFRAAMVAELPEHRRHIADALRTVWQDYGTYVAGTAETQERVGELADMRRMVDATLWSYTLARRGGGVARSTQTLAAVSNA